MINATINKFNNINIHVTSFYHDFTIELENDLSIIIYNDKNGEGFSMKSSSIAHLLREINCNNFRQLVSLFGGENDNIKIADTWSDETISAYEHIRHHINKTFEIKNYSDKALLLEAIPYTLTPYIEKLQKQRINATV